MVKFILLILLLSLTTSVFAQSEGNNAARAKAFIDALVRKDFAAAHDQFSDEVKAQLTVESLSKLWKSVEQKSGAFKAQGKVITTNIPGAEKIATICEFESDQIAITLVFGDSKIKGFLFEDPKNYASYAPPAYADQTSFTEREVSVGSGKWILPATLTVPTGAGPFRAVVLVHGSGANDRDETHVNPANKVFKDLAWGLASRGIAVLRYEKRNKQYPKEFAEIKDRTVNDETVDDALAAVQLLKSTPGVNSKKIYLLGHSLGGLMIPRIGSRDSSIAGLIVMAGTARPLEDVILEQYNYLTSLDGNVSDAEQKLLDNAKADYAIIKSDAIREQPSATKLLGLPVSYWTDWKTYNPSIAAKDVKQPMLILQGENDYQVTMADFKLWKDALGNSKNVTFRAYPKLTHTFMEATEAKPGPKDYSQINHVNEKVIRDIADWILQQS